MAESKTYHGVWQVPDSRGMYARQFIGTLTYYGDKPSTLELIQEPNSGSVAVNAQYDVLWGEDVGGVKYTLFGATMVREMDFSKFTFVIRFILIGKHVRSLDEPCFDSCWVKFPYLNHWALDSRFNGGARSNMTIVSFDLGKRPPVLTAEIEENVKIMLWGCINDHFTPYEIKAFQATDLNIDTLENTSLNTYLKTISEFSQFLSIALFAEQHPGEVVFANKGVRINYPLLFDTKTSKEPWVLPLIKFDVLSQRIPDVLKQWHTHFDRVSPITHYLIRSLGNGNTFDTPDFLTIAQALDGYFKRFVNNKDGKDTRQYKQQIEKLLKLFKGVEVIQRINLDAEILAQTRHKYSHLIPDEDAKIAKALDEGAPLYWLTQKCIVLLTCCILDMLGLTTDEINLCCNNSPLNQIVISIPTWI